MKCSVTSKFTLASKLLLCCFFFFMSKQLSFASLKCCDVLKSEINSSNDLNFYLRLINTFKNFSNLENGSAKPISNSKLLQSIKFLNIYEIKMNNIIIEIYENDFGTLYISLKRKYVYFLPIQLDYCIYLNNWIAKMEDFNLTKIKLFNNEEPNEMDPQSPLDVKFEKIYQKSNSKYNYLNDRTTISSLFVYQLHIDMHNKYIKTLKFKPYSRYNISIEMLDYFKLIKITMNKEFPRFAKLSPNESFILLIFDDRRILLSLNLTISKIVQYNLTI